MRLLVISLALLANSVAIGETDGFEAWLKKLDESLENKEKYENMHKERIADLCKEFDASDDIEKRYILCRDIFEEYKSYRSDSALAYANLCLQYADRIGDVNYMAEARCLKASCQTLMGLITEATKTLADVTPSLLDDRTKACYCYVSSKLWQENASYVSDTPYYQEYSRRSNAYLDTLLTLLPHGSSEYWLNRCSYDMRLGQPREGIADFKEYLNTNDSSLHNHAIAYAEAAWGYVVLDDIDSAKICFARSAIYDNEGSVREITALYQLARLIYKDNPLRANRYIHMALNDISFYDSRLRKVELGEILPIIDRYHLETVERQRNLVAVVMCLITLMLIGSLLAVSIVRRKNRKIRQSQKVIEESNEELKVINSRLIEANKIKNEYVGLSFYANSELITRLQKVFLSLERKIVTRQFKDIKETINQAVISEERNNMYVAFDAAFLRIFPDFTEKYNQLFDEKDRVIPKKGGLTSEMRIFALIRLGITDSERIANFLNYSVHTINTYKTRVKNRSVVDNAEFETAIMAI